MPAALLIADVAPALAVGAIVLAISPAELAAPALARALGGRMETAAAITVGTVVLSLALLGSIVSQTGAAQATVGMAFFGFMAGVVLGGSAPRVRDALLPTLRAAGRVALTILVVGALVAAIPALRADTAVAALALLAAGVVPAWLVVGFLGGDRTGIVLGGGTRDFAVAATVASAAGGGAASSALPLVYGALLFGGAGLVAMLRGRRG